MISSYYTYYAYYSYHFQNQDTFVHFRFKPTRFTYRDAILFVEVSFDLDDVVVIVFVLIHGDSSSCVVILCSAIIPQWWTPECRWRHVLRIIRQILRLPSYVLHGSSLQMNIFAKFIRPNKMV